VSLQRDLGVLYAAQGQAEKASVAFEVLLDAIKNPDAYSLDARARAALLADPETTYDRLGQTFLDANKTDLAVEAFEKAAEARRNKPGVLQYDLARVYLKAGKPDKALEQLESYIKDERTDRGRAAYDLLGEVLAALGRDKEIDDRLRGIIERDAENPHAKLVLAERYAAADKLDDAATLYEQALEDLKDPSGYLGLAEIYRRQKKADKLVELLARAAVAGAEDESLSGALTKVAEDKDLTAKILDRGRVDAEAQPPKLDFATAFLFGKLAAEAERVDDAAIFYRLAARIRPDRAADIYDELGLAQLLAEKYDDAIETYRKALESPADDGARAQLLFRLSQALEFSGKTEEALARIDEALKIIPEASLLHYQRGWIHFHAKQWDEAAALFQQVIERFPQEADTVRQARLSLSALYVEMGDKAKGEQVLEEVYAIDPDDPSVNNDLGYLYADQGKKLEQAEGMIRKALASEPENAAYLDSMGWVLHRLGRDEEAVAHLEKAVSQPDGDDATLWEHLGDVYDKLGKAEKAREAWQKALEQAKKETPPKPDQIKAIEEKLSRPAK
jgi:tetratricopeptide (TPR) repeat protein